MCELIGACWLSCLYLGLGGAGARRGSSGSCETVVRGRGGSPEKETEEAMKRAGAIPEGVEGERGASGRGLYRRLIVSRECTRILVAQRVRRQ